MATTTSTAPPQTLSTTITTTSLTTTKPRPNHISLPTRRHLLFLLTLSTSTTTAPFLTPKQPISRAEDIPLFGLRKTLKKAEQETEELVREGFKAAEKGIVAAEKGIVAAEKGVEAAQREIEVVEGAVSFGGLAQAGAVAGAEAVGVLVATAVVNGILGPEANRS